MIEMRGTGAISGLVCIDMPPKPLSDRPGDWVEGSVVEVASTFRRVRTREGQAALFAEMARSLLVQRNLTDAELSPIVEESGNTPSWVASLLYADAVFSDCLAVAQNRAREIPTLFVVAEHWSGVGTSFLRDHFPNSSVATLGGHMMLWEHPRSFNAELQAFLSAHQL